MRPQPAPQGMHGQPPAPMGAGGLTPEMAKEAQAKFEEADALGRVMAHAYVEELDKIASSRETEKTAGRFDRAGAAAKEVAGRAKNFAKSDKGKMVGAGAAGVAAGGTIGNAVGRRQGKSKEASAFEKLAFDRAAEVLQTLGIDPATGQPFQDQGQAQPQGQEPDFGQALDARALEILSEAGYDSSQVATAYNQTVNEAPQQ